MAEEEQEDDVVEAKSGSKKMIIIIAGGVMALLIIVAATLFFTGFFDEKAPVNADDATQELSESENTTTDDGDEAASEDEKQTLYQELKPPFMVNFQGSSIRVMKVSISVMARDEATLEAVKLHNPVIRNNLLLLLSSEDPELLKTSDGKTKLQTSILEEINKVLKERKAKTLVEAVFFTDLVMQ